MAPLSCAFGQHCLDSVRKKQRDGERKRGREEADRREGRKGRGEKGRRERGRGGKEMGREREGQMVGSQNSHQVVPNPL